MKHTPYVSPSIAFLALAAVSVLISWRPLVDTFRLALANDAYTHLLLILPLSAALIHFDRKALKVDVRPSPRIGMTVLFLAGLMFYFAKWGWVRATDDVWLFVFMVALVTWWIASVIFCFGIRKFEVLAFPICFLYMLVPIPQFAVDRIIEFLQHQSAFAAEWMFRSVAVPVTREGIMLSIPGMDIEVAPQCSSIRSSMMLVIITMVLAHLFLRSWWRKVLLIAVAVPLSVAKNGLRVFTIAELGTRVNPSFFEGRLHRQGGIVFLGIALVATIALLWLLHCNEVHAVHAQND
jgi:exosortase